MAPEVSTQALGIHDDAQILGLRWARRGGHPEHRDPEEAGPRQLLFQVRDTDEEALVNMASGTRI